MSVNGKKTSDEWYEPFPSEDIFDKGDTCLSNKYKELSKDLFGEIEERMTRLITDLKDVAKKKGIEVPGTPEIFYSLKDRCTSRPGYRIDNSRQISGIPTIKQCCL